MGTELHSPNSFHPILKSNHHVDGNRIISRDKLLKQSRSTGFGHLPEFMNMSLGQHDREYVKKIMMKHEEIFKQQVHELHRLYKVQKILMAEMNIKKMKLHSITNGSATTSETSHSSNWSYRLQSPSTVPCYGQPSTAQMASDLRRPAIQCDALTEAVADNELEECDVELTLSIGCNSSKTKKAQCLQKDNKLMNSPQATPSKTFGEDCSDPSVTTDRESLEDSPWIFQALSLKRT
ncbi:uncharacterized protein LOC120278763 isoform X1 [Dioscorea cayenensis subsp. rotundata]|uniref:Uncharacterized protein LOC120278763 isoform X1 n=1 Tax=Dioscorea cayennensis subsp. rotundata TaxID=55577 RepID=A0AB40CTM9_DIOCR|nr:uncharacterized protein LOC120278763 isoform X1 [Dioscorea cayenensis subsp. rotundata]XP_039141423.1 uncharacterized protein LOC120278763 isoform X1 [Dioscorea cayenensis subsp. rotundata]XP_039141424.1 uncharacterized protein LOC120278763 isoform X1 [Dioscorea cayenensis subsp. rotundata]XP_039141425.1 uncharacterized protein LOC120278763 isoform X1 [Dioscorea cayenensis subsp. rotundata]